jgi:hypothetical protein
MRKLIALLAIASVGLVAAGMAVAGHGDGEPEVAPSLFVGNPSCTGGAKTAGGNVTSQVLPAFFSGFAGSITITRVDTPQGPTFSFITDGPSHLVTSVLVKGGPNANLYDYGTGIAHDDGLHAPLNPDNGKYYGLSHACFFTDKK